MKKTIITIFSLLVALVFIAPNFALADTPDDDIAYITLNPTSGDSISSFGQSTSQYGNGIAWKYIAPDSHELCNAHIDLKKQGSPTDGLKVKVQLGSLTDTDPSDGYGLFSESQEILGSTLTTSLVSYTFNFQNCPILVGNAVYWIIMYRTGSVSDSNYYINTQKVPSTSTTVSVLNFANVSSFGKFTTGTWNQPSNSYFAIRLGGVVSDPSFPSPGGFGTQGCTSASSATRYLCEIFQYLFIPNGGLSTYITNSIDTIITHAHDKAPFSYFYSLEDAFGDLDTSSDTGYLIDAVVNINGPTGYFELPIQGFNTDPYSDDIVPFDTVRPYINAFLWLGFGYYLLTRSFKLFRAV